MRSLSINKRRFAKAILKNEFLACSLEQEQILSTSRDRVGARSIQTIPIHTQSDFTYTINFKKLVNP